MNEVLIHKMPVRARGLAQRLESVLQQLPEPESSALASRLVLSVHDVPRIVFTGQYSSGKSTLIKALTDASADVVIGADITTDSVTAYDWDGAVTLIDTPGVRAGVKVHDELAEAAIAAADMILFTVTVDLFDDSSAQHLRDVLTEKWGKGDQTLVVITKSGTMAAAEGVRERAVQEVISAGSVPPIVECDAGDYLRSLTHPDPNRASAYRISSGIDKLRSEINRLSQARGELAIHRQPFQLVKALSMEVQSHLTEDPDERAALSLLARQRAVLAARRQRIEIQLSGLATSFRSRSMRAAEVFADGVESVEDVAEGPLREGHISHFISELERDLGQATAALGSEVERLLSFQFDDLAAEVREIEASPHARLVLDLAGGNDVQLDARGAAEPIRVPRAYQGVSASAGGVPPWAYDAGEWIKQFQSMWGAGAGARASAGSVGHKLVLDVGHFFDVKFKPWGAVNIADRLGKAAKVAGVALTIGLAVTEVIVEERAQVKFERARAGRRAALVNEITGQSDEIARQALNEVRGHLDPLFQDAYSRIDVVHGEIVGTQKQRSSLMNELLAIQNECDVCLTQLPVGAPAGS